VAAVAPQPPAEAAALPVPAPPRARRRQAVERRPRVGTGVAWIALIGALLAGVVFINVAVLRLNIRLDKLGSQRTQLHNDIAALQSQVSSAQAAARIQAQAQRDLGVVPAATGDTTWVHLPAK
jgi:cell division protein FtsL